MSRLCKFFIELIPHKKTRQRLKMYSTLRNAKKLVAHYQDAIFVIGDSHTDIFNKNNYSSKKQLYKDNKLENLLQVSFNNLPFITYHIGAATAFTTNKSTSSFHTKEKTNFLIKNGLLPKGATILTSFGEIDCRVHVKKQAEKQHCSPEQVIDSIIHNYAEYLLELKNRGYHIIVYGPIASQPETTQIDPSFPRSGTEQERNHITRLFNQRLQKFCFLNGLEFFTIFEDLLNDDNTTKREFLRQEDGVHLNEKAYPFLERVLTRHIFKEIDTKEIKKIKSFDTQLQRWIAKLLTCLIFNKRKKQEARFRLSLSFRKYFSQNRKLIKSKYVDTQITTCPPTLSFTSPAKPLISIIIPVYNQYDYTMRCLTTLHKNTHLPYEVILVDDCSTDDTRTIETRVKGITILHSQKNQGFLLNCNMAAKHAKGEYIYLLNNDTQVLPNTIEELYNTFQTHDNAGAVGSKLIQKNGLLQWAGNEISPDLQVWGYGLNQDPTLPKYNYLRSVAFCGGASLMIPKKLWDELGGFDERFVPGYYEETDLCLRLRHKGYAVYYQPKSEIIHFQGMSFTGQNTSKYMKINGEKFKEKWKNKNE